MVTRRTKGYEDLDDNNGSLSSNVSPELDQNSVIPQEIEMASVSVVPDGNITVFLYIFV